MIIRTEAERGASTVQLVGRFDAHEAPGFRSAVTPLVAAATPDVRLDLSQVAFVDSTALAELVRLQKVATAHGGGVSFSALSDPVRVILEITDLADVFTLPGSTPDVR